MCADMPAWVAQSPAVVIVRKPSTKDSGSLGSGVGLQRKLAERHLEFGARRRTQEALVGLPELARVAHGRADPIEPGALVGGAGRGEGGARNLLGIKAVGAALRRVAADGQGPGSASVSNVLPKPDR